MEDAALAGPDLLERLRGVGVERPSVDPAGVAGLRAEMEAAAADIDGAPDEVVVRVNKRRLREVLLCERHMMASLVPTGGTSLELVAGRLLDRLFSLVVIGHPIVTDPFATAMAASAVAGEADVADAFETLSAEDQAEVRVRVDSVGRTLAARWPLLPANAFVRCQEPLRAEVAGGRVLLTGRVDLTLGRPTATHAGTTLIDVKSGRRRYDDALDADWYAVLEALRHQAPPFQSGSYYLRDGGLDLVVYDPSRLQAAAQRIAEGVRRLVRLAAGGAPSLTPNGLCPWCPVFESCPPGRAHAADSGFEAAVPEHDDEDPDVES